MDVSHLAHLIRRSRSRSFAAGPAGHGNLDVRSPNGSANGIVLEKKAAGEYGHVTAPSGAATRTVGQAVQITSTQRQAAQAATIGMTNKRPDLITATRVSTSEGSAKATLAAASSAKSTIAQPSSAVPSTTSTSTSTSSSTSISTSTSTSSSTSTTPSTTSTRASTTTSSATPTSTSTSSAVRALTTSSSSTRSALPSSTLDAAKASTSSSGMSTGAVVGIALGAIVGVVVIGSFIGWLYRKYTARSYSSKSPWAKIDDDITPYPPPNEKYSDSPADDIYGGAAAPVIGSRRALALARENAYDGSLRPDSEMYDRGSNHAGFGAGNMGMATSPTYGYDAQGRPYNPQAGATPMSYGYEDQYSPYYDQSPQSADHRQLVGPNAHPYAVAMPTAMPMGRPHAPSTAAEFALAEDFADEPLTPGLAYTADEPRTPISQIGTAIAPAGPNGHYNQNRSRVSLTPQAPRVMSPTESLTVHDTVPAPHLAPPPPVASANSLTPSHIPLPAFAPLSPLMDDFTFNKRQSQPLGMYEDERSAQKRMYGEVASTAGIVEPTTPYSAGPSPNPGLNDSTTSTTSSFSAPQANTSTETMRLPELTLNPPEPYIHGQPLSPLKEVPTPLSTASTGEPLLNPFDLPLPTRNPVGSSNLSAPITPYTASTAGATGYPSAVLSAAYPPPSPGGMSVPGSVTDSPRWVNDSSSTPRGRAVSVYEEDDAYGGI
ncbi:hypothetical protein I302_100786 [Kwoniella bestiolae CBS 10118]|uniref:Uncharacterized protein n=1 Tax=Kwoniella bestiolae CBS 10118 TaxID=1296100 RepID=A0A1B9G614_9TREE|nr:hypothetical protein I302_04159 [Kwoniella bestiolae CBS 10118]OCF26474.1 hypothetical protein I302_04159 [Kwoniella bestiolae CBS 10118]